MNTNTKIHSFFFYLVLSVCLVVPFSIDLFISGLPAISHAFPGADVSWILSIALLGIAIAQPVYGPLLDRFGRKPVLLCGLFVYTLASLEIILVHSFTALLIGRFIQALGACSAIISAFAIVRDCYHGEQLIKAMSTVMALIGVSPALAPLLGSILNNKWGWKASFIFLFGVGCFYTLLILFFFKETQREKNYHALSLVHIGRNYNQLIKSAGFLPYALISALSYGILFSYFNLSSFFLIAQMHFGLIAYGWIVAFNALAIIIMAKYTPAIVSKITLLRALQLGVLLIFLGGIGMGLSSDYFGENLYTFMIPMFITTLGIGMIRPTAGAGAMHVAHHKMTGSAAALFNFISFIGSALATTVTAKIIGNVVDFGLFVIFMALAALLVSAMIRTTITVH